LICQQIPWDKPHDACISVKSVVHDEQWFRLVMSTFEHGDEWHLYYNMISFLWKGKTLETLFGLKFAFILAVFTVLTNITYLCLNSLFAVLLYNPSYLQHCAVGFSGKSLLITKVSLLNKQSIYCSPHLYLCLLVYYSKH